MADRARWAILLRGINVGGKNRVPMLELRQLLTDLGFEAVQSYIASGNIVLESALSAAEITQKIETALPKHFPLSDELVRILALPKADYARVLAEKPQGFGDSPDTYHSDVIFLLDHDASQAIQFWKPREGVDSIWAGPGVIYSQRLSAERTKSSLNKVLSLPAYKQMTIRNWNTTRKIWELLSWEEAPELQQ